MTYKRIGIAVLCGLLLAAGVEAAEKRTVARENAYSSNYQVKQVPLDKKDMAEIKKTLPKGQKVPMVEQRVFYKGVMLPRDYQKIEIFGENVATMGQAAAYIRANAPYVKLDCSIEELVELYWKEAAVEGVRADLAICQAILETGFFCYGGDVSRHQNNFCGLGTVGGGARGAGFNTPQLGVRAHIQHLFAYSQKEKPKTKIIDPRYDLAHNIRLERGLVKTWYGLNGTWAMGKEYCEKIMNNYVNMLAIQGVPATFDTRVKANGERRSLKDRLKRLNASRYKK